MEIDVNTVMVSGSIGDSKNIFENIWWKKQPSDTVYRFN